MSYFIPALFILATQFASYLLLKRRLHLASIILPNISLLGFGLVVSVIGFIVAIGEPNSWAGLGLIILLMITFVSVLISLGLSMLIFVFLKHQAKSL